MKRSTRKSSRRKWVVGGVAFFGSIALLTTGFATWVVGAQQAATEGTVNVVVDTVNNESFKIEATLNDSEIKLQETTACEDGSVISFEEGEGFAVNPTALDITFSSITITMGNSAKTPTGLQFSLDSTDLKGKPANTNNTVESDMNVFTKAGETRGSGPWTYIDAPEAISFSSSSKNYSADTEGDNTVWTLTDLDYSFKWGTFFNHKSPCTFYNSFFKTNNDALPSDADQIASELNTMSEAFKTNTTLTLRLTLTFDDEPNE